MKKPTDEFLAESALPLPKTAKTRSGVESSPSIQLAGLSAMEQDRYRLTSPC